jgi:hydroxymethylbilane synthase
MPDRDSPLRVGTRGSPLALAQAEETRARLAAAHGLPVEAFEIVKIRTTGDRVTDRPLKEIGGKGLFTKEIEEALLAGRIDVAVHSMKDMEVAQPAGLALDTFLPRQDPRDAFVAPAGGRLAGLRQGATVGTSSLRRRAQLLHRRPDLRVVEFRGNVQTRLRKLSEGVAEATLLAMAGLNRLGLPDVPATPIPADEMLPAVAQGAIGIERRADDGRVAALLEAVHDGATGLRVTAERAFLARLDGSCETPIAGLAELDGGGLRLRGEILRPDGSEAVADEVGGAAEDGAALGRGLAEELLARAGPGFFDWRGLG